MTDPSSQFRLALRGYDPGQVDRRVRALTDAAATARQQAEELSARVRQLEEEQAGAAAGDGASAPPSFTHLGERVGQILALAEEEAEELRRCAHEEVAAERGALEETVARVRAEADRHAEERRSDADQAAARMLEEARRAADELIDGAERDAAARLQEAEAVYEDQRARAAQAATDFETTLVSRRQAAEREFTQEMSEAKKHLAEIEEQIDRSRAEAETRQADALRQARRIVDEAESQASSIINDAKAVAARVRADSERELAAAIQRRDSINAQLANVRQMLATLTGASPIVLAQDVFGGSDRDGGSNGGERDNEETVPDPDSEASLRSDPDSAPDGSTESYPGEEHPEEGFLGEALASAASETAD